MNPLGTVPCIFDAGAGVFESAFVVEFLEERFPGRGTALMPAAPAERAAVRLFVSQLDFAPWYKMLMAGPSASAEALAEHEAAVTASLAAIEARYATRSASGPFFLGDALSAADVALLPFVDRFSASLKAHRGFDFLAACARVAPRVAAAYAAVQARPAWKATAQAPSFYNAAYSGYASGKPGVPRRVPAALLAAA